MKHSISQMQYRNSSTNTIKITGRLSISDCFLMESKLVNDEHPVHVFSIALLFDSSEFQDYKMVRYTRQTCKTTLEIIDHEEHCNDVLKSPAARMYEELYRTILNMRAEIPTKLIDIKDISRKFLAYEKISFSLKCAIKEIQSREIDDLFNKYEERIKSIELLKVRKYIQSIDQEKKDRVKKHDDYTDEIIRLQNDGYTHDVHRIYNELYDDITYLDLNGAFESIRDFYIISDSSSKVLSLDNYQIMNDVEKLSSDLENRNIFKKNIFFITGFFSRPEELHIKIKRLTESIKQTYKKDFLTDLLAYKIAKMYEESILDHKSSIEHIEQQLWVLINDKVDTRIKTISNDIDKINEALLKQTFDAHEALYHKISQKLSQGPQNNTLEQSKEVIKGLGYSIDKVLQNKDKIVNMILSMGIQKSAISASEVDMMQSILEYLENNSTLEKEYKNFNINLQNHTKVCTEANDKLKELKNEAIEIVQEKSKEIVKLFNRCKKNFHSNDENIQKLSKITKSIFDYKTLSTFLSNIQEYSDILEHKRISEENIKFLEESHIGIKEKYESLYDSLVENYKMSNKEEVKETDDISKQLVTLYIQRKDTSIYEFKNEVHQLLSDINEISTYRNTNNPKIDLCFYILKKFLTIMISRTEEVMDQLLQTTNDSINKYKTRNESQRVIGIIKKIKGCESSYLKGMKNIKNLTKGFETHEKNSSKIDLDQHKINSIIKDVDTKDFNSIVTEIKNLLDNEEKIKNLHDEYRSDVQNIYIQSPYEEDTIQNDNITNNNGTIEQANNDIHADYDNDMVGSEYNAHYS